MARALQLRSRETLIVERGNRFGEETSARNSGVIHAGLYYPTGSHKARLCVRGRTLLYDYCQARAIPHRPDRQAARRGRRPRTRSPAAHPRARPRQRRRRPLVAHRLAPGFTGIRPKLGGPDQAEADFRIAGPEVHDVPGLIHLLGIDSPGLTSCLAIAEYVAEIL